MFFCRRLIVSTFVRKTQIFIFNCPQINLFSLPGNGRAMSAVSGHYLEFANKATASDKKLFKLISLVNSLDRASSFNSCLCRDEAEKTPSE